MALYHLLLRGTNISSAPDSSYNVSRSDIENRFISKLKSSESNFRNYFKFDTAYLQPYGQDLYILPGESYLKDGIINRNTYFYLDEISPVWECCYPMESISNLFIFPTVKHSDIGMEVTVLKHEYGEKDVIETTVGHLLAVCENEGCIPYWGVNSFEKGHIEGTLFLVNKDCGYNHILRIQCDTDDIFSKRNRIIARASLYIPTGNIDNLFQPTDSFEIIER